MRIPTRKNLNGFNQIRIRIKKIRIFLVSKDPEGFASSYVPTESDSENIFVDPNPNKILSDRQHWSILPGSAVELLCSVSNSPGDRTNQTCKS
jgi:hypothetical protein